MPVTLILKSVSGRMRNTSGFVGRTTKDGRFSITIPASIFTAQYPHILVQITPPSGDEVLDYGPKPEVWHGIIPIPKSSPPNVVECGDVVMGADPLLVRGKVTNMAGMPLEYVRISVLLRQQSASSGSVEWKPVDGLSQRTAHDGTWQVRTPWEVGVFKVAAALSGYMPRRSGMLQKPGQRVDMQLDRGFIISGHLLLPTGVSGYPLQCGITKVGGKPNQRRYFRVNAGGLFRISGLQEGIYHFGIFVQHQLINAVLGVHAWHPGGVPDDRLSAIDVRHDIIVMKLLVRDPSGKPLKNAICALNPIDPKLSSLSGTTDSEGHVAFFYAGPKRSFMLYAIDHGSAMVAPEPLDQEIQLSAGRIVPLAIANMSLIPPHPLELEVQAQLVTGKGGLKGMPLGVAIFNNKGRALLRVPRAGKHLLTINMMSATGFPTVRVRIPMVTPLIVDVPQEGVAERVLIDLDPNAVQAAQTELAR